MIVIVQFRTDQSGPHEVQCFYDSLGVKYNELQFVNVANSNMKSDFVDKAFNAADAIILGGCGEASFGSTDENKVRLVTHMRSVLKEPLKKAIQTDNKPILGICFGNQMICNALGCEVVRNPNMSEGGIVQVNLNEDGQSDPLFKGMPGSFYAVSAHKDSVETMPKGGQLLGSSARYPQHVLKIGKRVYALMFHPELDEASMQYRMNLYLDYKKEEDAKTPEQSIITETILKNFVALIKR